MATIGEAKNQKYLLYTILLSGVMATLNTTTVHIALPTFMDIFHTSLATVQWISVGYMFALAAVMPMVGYLGDRYTYRKLYIVAHIAMIVMAIGCALSINVGMLITFRVLKGLAAGLLLPCGMTMVYRYVPKAQQASYLGWTVTFGSVGSVVGPSIAGVLLTFFSWHSIFLVNIPVVALSCYFAYQSIPQEDGVRGEAFDFLGVLLMASATLCVLVGFSQMDVLPIKGIATLVGIGIVLFAFFVRRALRVTTPVLNFAVLKYSHFATTILADVFRQVVITITPIMMAVYLQTLLGFSVLQAGIFLMLPSLVMVFATNTARVAIKKTSNKRLILGGLLFVIVGNLVLTRLQLTTALWGLMLALCSRYWGMGLANMPLTDYGMKVLPPELAGHGSAMINWTKQTASVIWVGLLTGLYTVVTNRGLHEMLAESQAMMNGVNAVFSVVLAVLIVMWVVLFIKMEE